jgi:D-arabinitol dehydrogenase (NADP+)
MKAVACQAPRESGVVPVPDPRPGEGEMLLESARDGGTVLLYGMAGQQTVIPVRPYEIFRRQRTIKGSFAQRHCFDRALRLLGSGLVCTDGIITHVPGLEEYGRAPTLPRGEPSCLKAASAP